MYFRKIFLYLILSLFVISVSLVSRLISEENKSEIYYQFNDKGELIIPDAYREWIFIGAPVTPNELNNGKSAFPEFHNVYIDPVSYKQYKETGKFREGTIIIKELVSIGAKSAASGNGYFEGEYIGLEATIKDSKRFAEDPGNWAYFTFSHEAPPYPETAKKNDVSTCNSCHQVNAAEDWVFTQYYPVLRAVKSKK